MIVLDTNVLSEVIAREPSPLVLSWLELQSTDTLYTTSVTQAELLYGIEVMSLGKRRRELQDAASRMLAEDFDGRILSFDSEAAEVYARLAAARRKMGPPIIAADAQIAAIAFSRSAELATRNVRDFEHCGIKVLNPWGARRS